MLMLMQRADAIDIDAMKLTTLCHDADDAAITLPMLT